MTKRMGPGDVPQNSPVQMVPDSPVPVSAEEWKAAMDNHPLMVLDNPDEDHIAAVAHALQGLRAPFPGERIEKLPKPLWKGAWDGERKGNCSECGGYHVLANTIHLDYVGHANATDRILEVDPFWDWEPMALTPEGLPLFDRSGGLWIKLTICGVTRLGYGDGNSVKEVIGDAIRNAAMRFGLALDLWAKINLHEERNPGDGPTQPRSNRPASNSGQASARHQDERVAPTNPSRAPNQDALDELLSICTENGLDPRAVEATYNDKYAPPRLTQAHEDDIRNYAALILDQLEGPPDAGAQPVGDDAGVAEPVSDDTSDEAQAGPEVRNQPADERAGGVGEVAPAEPAPAVDPEDTSDVEKKPDEAF